MGVVTMVMVEKHEEEKEEKKRQQSIAKLSEGRCAGRTLVLFGGYWNKV